MQEHMTETSDTGTIICTSICTLLNELKIPYTLTSHEPVYTMEEADGISHNKPEEGIKCLLLKVYKSKSDKIYVLAVWRGDRRVDMAAVTTLFGGKEAKMATPQEVNEQLHIDIGALAPFGYDKIIPTVVDKQISQTTRAFINPGRHDQTLELSSKNLISAITTWSDQAAKII